MKTLRAPAALAILVGTLSTPALARDLSFEDRVRAQEAIERVYYAHQIGATKPFEQAVPRDVLEKKVAERDGIDLLADGAVASRAHASLVVFVRARPRQWNVPQWQAGSFGLRLEHGPPRTMHGHAIEIAIERGEQAYHLDIAALAQDVQGPRTIFAAAPGE